MIVRVVHSYSITNIESLPETCISSLSHIVNLKSPGDFTTFPTFIKKDLCKCFISRGDSLSNCSLYGDVQNTVL